MSPSDKKIFEEELNRLRVITDGCRIDMHEPDEQELSARVVGDRLDNAMGSSIDARSVELGYQELVVILSREYSSGKIRREVFNLADLIALARMARIEDSLG